MTIPHSARAASLFVAGIVLAVGAAGCDGSSGNQSGGTGGHVSSSSQMSVSSTGPSGNSTASAGAGDSTGSGAQACEPPSTAHSFFSGWKQYTGLTKYCPYYVPPDTQHLPSPVAWQACPAGDGGAPYACRMMVEDWSTDPIPISNTFVFFDGSDSGKPLLSFTRIMSKSPLYLSQIIAEVDGPVLDALGLAGNTCAFWASTFREHRYGQMLQNLSACGGTLGAQGAAVGVAEHLAVPSRVVMCPAGVACGFSVGASWIVRIDAPDFQTTAYPWAGGDAVVVSSSSADPEHLQLANIFPSGDAIFFESSDDSHSGVNVWTLLGGAKPFVRWVGDATQAAGDLGTDKTNLVWSYGKGTPAPGHPGSWGHVDVYTAPYTTDPTMLASRRVRSSGVNFIGNNPWVVGCGYAARTGGPDPFVVRLSDGVLWSLPFGKNGDSARFYSPIGISCTEVFMLGQFAGQWNIARVRLDSLVTGNPAD